MSQIESCDAKPKCSHDILKHRRRYVATADLQLAEVELLFIFLRHVVVVVVVVVVETALYMRHWCSTERLVERVGTVKRG